jgi:ribosomal protein L11 methyltransferase
LCLDWLARNATPGLTLLDFGCGSGVLSLAGIALGARATATDIDPQALAATRANAERNAMPERISIVTPQQLIADAPFDLIVANILSNTLVTLAPQLLSHARPGTRIALSGILADQIKQVRSAYEQSVRFAEPSTQTGWSLLHGTVA